MVFKCIGFGFEENGFYVLCWWFEENHRCCQSPFACHCGYPFFVVGLADFDFDLNPNPKPLENLGLKRRESDRERGWERLGVKELRRWVRVNQQRWREKRDDRETKGLVCDERASERERERWETMERERERQWGKVTKIRDKGKREIILYYFFIV